MPVYNTVNYLEPTATIPIMYNLNGTGTQALTAPAFLDNRAWRVTSVVMSATAAPSSSVASVLVRLYGAVIGSGSTGVSEITLQTRRLNVSLSPINLQIRQAKRVQHAIANAATLFDVVGGSAAFAVEGVVNLSVRGGLG